MQESISANSADVVSLPSHSGTSNRHKPLDNLVLNTNKAGMQGLDTEKVNAIIQQASEGSRFYLHKQQSQKKLDAKIEEMLLLKKSFSQQQITEAAHQMREAAELLSEERDLTRTIVHVDMDMFYAAVEMRDDPKLSNIAMAVGSPGMLSTSNYAARKYGVRAGMPGFIGLKLCPELVIVPTNFDKYREVSKRVGEVFALYDPQYVMMSLDEAYLDLTVYIAQHSEQYQQDDSSRTVAETVVEEMRDKIQQSTQLTASAGIAANTRLSKVCSDLNKPDGQYYLPSDAETIMDFVRSLPIRKISGVGNVLEQQLRGLGIATCGDLQLHYGELQLLYSDNSISYFLHISLGLGETCLANMASGERKSISTETTFTGTTSRQQCLDILHKLCQELQQDMQRKCLAGKLVTLKIKSVDFVLKTRSVSLGAPTQDVEVISRASKKLLLLEMEKYSQEKPLALRLLGVRLSTLSDSAANNSQGKQAMISNFFTQSSDNSNNMSAENITIARDEFDNNLPQGNLPKCSVDTQYICPVCNRLIPTKFLTVFNKHIDTCLNEDSSNGCLTNSFEPVSQNELTDCKIPFIEDVEGSSCKPVVPSASNQSSVPRALYSSLEVQREETRTLPPNHSSITHIPRAPSLSVERHRETSNIVSTSPSSLSSVARIPSPSVQEQVEASNTIPTSPSSIPSAARVPSPSVQGQLEASNTVPTSPSSLPSVARVPSPSVQEQLESSNTLSLSSASITDVTKAPNPSFGVQRKASSSTCNVLTCLVCPVCYSAQFSCDILLNRHLDECLSLQHLSCATPHPTRPHLLQTKHHSTKRKRSSRINKKDTSTLNTITKYFK